MQHLLCGCGERSHHLVKQEAMPFHVYVCFYMADFGFHGGRSDAMWLWRQMTFSRFCMSSFSVYCSSNQRMLNDDLPSGIWFSVARSCMWWSESRRRANKYGSMLFKGRFVQSFHIFCLFGFRSPSGSHLFHAHVCTYGTQWLKNHDTSTRDNQNIANFCTFAHWTDCWNAFAIENEVHVITFTFTQTQE